MEFANFLLFTILISVSILNVEAIKIKTSLGNIKGYYKTPENGKRYAAFEGIPYALPPVGELRFEPPQPPKKWKGELLATKLSDQCLRYIPKFDTLAGFLVKNKEDCLYLNVYVPELQTKDLLPVLFWIHGGAFTFGMPNVFDENYVVDKNVILVTINYRLGPLGFLSTEDDVVPGNMGLKDQSMALKWIHENIQSFGGDPEKVTLVGLGAGGASVHYHYFSPLSAGLFQNGISISGTALHQWANRNNTLKLTKKLGKIVGCPSSLGTRELVNCLKKSSAERIVGAVKDFSPYLYIPFYPFGPVVEKTNNSPFINVSPEEKLQKGEIQNVPWITSITNEEGLYPFLECINKDQIFRDSHSIPAQEMSECLKLYYLHNELPNVLNSLTIKKIKEVYHIKDSAFDPDNHKNVIKALGDKLFVYYSEKAAQMQAKMSKSPVWFYVYSYKAYKSINSLFSDMKMFEGVSHGDDVSLLFKLPYLESTDAKKDQVMRNDLLNLWTSFAKTGTQGLTKIWEEIDSSKDFHYLNIQGPGKFFMSNEKNLVNQDIWKDVHKFYKTVMDIIDLDDLEKNQKDEL